ncbi:MAG TPA: DUF5818 domain-containing protein [Terriglobales bacterium]
MTKTFLFGLVLLVSAAWLQAQNQYPQPGSSHAGASSQTTVRGCLQGSDGNYTLTASNGKTYQLQGDTSKLSAHVGHEVQITGTKASAASSTAAPAGTPPAGTEESTLTVEKMKHISATCKSASAK